MLQITDQTVPLSTDPGGTLLVTGTRVSLHSVVGMFEEGASAEEIAHEFDSLALADVYAVLTYYLRNREAVRSALMAEEERSEEAARRFDPSFRGELRKKLLSGRRSER